MENRKPAQINEKKNTKKTNKQTKKSSLQEKSLMLIKANPRDNENQILQHAKDKGERVSRENAAQELPW